MERLAIAYVTCDKYSHVWEEWHDAYLKYWGVDIPVYWCGEEEPAIDNDFIQVFHERVEADRWTTKLREQIERIPEEHIFIWLDDLIQQKIIDKPFRELYKWFVDSDADSLRMMGRDSRADYMRGIYIDGRVLHKLTERSPYLISYSPNIYRREFLLDILRVEESPWSSELNGSVRIQGQRRNIYAYHIDDWYINRVVQ